MKDGGKYEVVMRKLPLCQLGRLRLSTADKAATLTHQTWLEYGPEIESARAANSDVRSCLSDMGTELGIADMVDPTAAVLAAGPDPESLSAGTHMFPNALAIPGLQHILDVSLRYAIERVPWWPVWQQEGQSM